jgi:glycosyltransferase involved in cell wall biosynthesis
MNEPLSYGIITPVRNEADNLPRLADAVVSQSRLPVFWMIVDNGSDDGTVELARSLAEKHAWIRFLQIPSLPAGRGAPIVRSFHAGLAERPHEVDVIVGVDADVAFAPNYFERLVAEFAADDELGIASGGGWEQIRGEWRERHLTGSTVWGATRAYRRECLEQLLPLEERLGWDGIDEFKANALGWRTRIVPGLGFRHYRREGSRDGGWQARVAQGDFCWYVGYRPTYVLLRTAFNALRHPAACGLLWGYARGALTRAPRLGDEQAVAYVRSSQRLRNLVPRVRQALGRG